MTTALDRPKLLGHAQPRLFTPSLRELTPESTLGFQAIEFAEQVVGVELLDWQRWWLKWALELREDGGFRYRTILTLISRQNGKSFLLKILALYFLYMGKAQLVLGAAQSLDVAREAWQGAVDLAKGVDDLAAEIETVRYTNGEQCLTLANGARYRISAATRGAGRGLSVDLLVLDELREHRTWDAWSALTKTATARSNALIVGISNAGDDQSVVLNSLRSSALAAARVGQMRALGGPGVKPQELEAVDESLGLAEWSAPDGCELDDHRAWAAANPALGVTLSESALQSALVTDPPQVFRTENLCQRVDALDAAVDMESWKASADTARSLGEVRQRVAAVVDVAPDGRHVTLCGAAVLDDVRVLVEVLGAWSSVAAARRELRPLLGRIAPAVLGWFPAGPAAELGVDLRGLGAVELKGQDVVECCQEFASLVGARQIVHGDDPLLLAHIGGTSKLRSGDGWRFARKGVGHVDAAYAAAGAVRLARTLPPPAPKRTRARVF